MELDNTKTIAILGDRNSGKTNLAFHLLREYKGTKKIYLLGYPKQIDNFNTLSSFNDIFQLTDSIIFMDEIHRFIKMYDKNTNQSFLELLSLFSHNNNTLIFTTQLSQFITKTVEAFVDGWCLTKIAEIATLKNGGKAKRIVKDTVDPVCTRWSLALQQGQYLENCESNPVGMNGIKEFPFQGIGKDWRVQTPQQFAQQTTHQKSNSETNVSIQTQNKELEVKNETRNTIRR